MKTRLATPESRNARLAELRGILSNVRRRQESGGPAIKRYVRDYEDDAVGIRGLIEVLISAGLLIDAERIAVEAQNRLGPCTPLLIGIAQLCAASGQPGHARAALQKAIELSPKDAEAVCQLGKFSLVRGEIPGAIEAFRKATALNAELYDAHAGLAQALQRWGRATIAIKHYEKALTIRPEAVDCRCALGVAQALIGDYDAALVNVRAARAAKPDFLQAIGAEADILVSLNRRDEALALLAPVLTAARPHPSMATAFARVAAEAGRVDDAIALCRRVIADADARDTDRATVLFSLGGLYEKKGDYDAAFEAFQRGNRLSGPLEYNREMFAGYVDQISRAFAPRNLKRYVRGSDKSQLPIFIVGMPRSGTSLVEQILASHPQVFGAGELPDIGQMLLAIPRVIKEGPYPDCLLAASEAHVNQIAGEHLARLRELGGDNTRVTDKMPGNFQHLGLIWQLFPGARVIHCRRDPVDTCLGCYTTMFSAAHVYARDLASLGHFYRLYERLMAFWKKTLDLPILDVQYEELVSDPEPRVRALIEFCGLPWDDACMKFHESKRVVRTASIDQVRRPIYKTSVNRAGRYGAHLDPLRAALAESAAGSKGEAGN